jgi:predicted ATPase
MNFKPFEDRLLEFRSLTLLSGLNSTGKSSILQSLLLLRQSYQQKLLSNTGLALNGDLVNIGTAQDALFEGAKEDLIGFDINWKNSLKGAWRFGYDREVDVLNLTSQPVTEEIYKSSLFSNKFYYRQEKEGMMVSEVTSPNIDKNGRIDEWPDGFFDEWEKNLITLLKPRDV